MTRYSFNKILLLFLAGVAFSAVWLGSSSCKKDRLLDSGGEIRFSTDTLSFNTVFTALGTATQTVKIFNKQNQKIVLSSVRLEGGSSSFFSLNVDGRQGKSASDIEIAANDSVYVFATVKVDPTDQNTPFIIEDKLTATLNGKDFSIPVIAYGQNAHFITDSLLETQTWLTDKPYVVFGVALVDAGTTLTIPAGCRVYMHANARLFVEGTLTAIGTKQDSIIFQGDRLDRAYFGNEGYPGEWGGIYFTSHSSGSQLTHVILRNGGNGAQGVTPALIQLAPDSVHNPLAPQLTMDKVILENSIGYGLLSFAGTLIAQNCLIHSCGASALALLQGGDYHLDYCTIATYGNNKIAHTDNPAAVILNYFINQYKELVPGALKCTLRNCVVAGSLTNEFVADDTSLAQASLVLQNCVLKAEKDKTEPWVSQTSVQYLGPSAAFNSLFKDALKGDYHPSSTSILIDMAVASLIDSDLEDQHRPKGNAPDIGCYEAR